MKFKKGKRAKNHEWKTYLLFFLIILIGGIISISFTGRQTALQSDASDYFKLASEMSISRNGPMSFITQKTYVDIGYPFILSFVMRLFSNNFIVYQLVNYVFWFLSTVFIYKSFNILTNKNKAFWGSLIMACSPIFLTFSAKLYSEPFAALGVAMTIYFFIAYKEKGKLPDLIGVVFGAIIFSFTKSVFVLLVIFALLASIKNKNLLEYLVLGFGILTLITRFYFSYEGGRSDQILITQVIKVRQSYTTLAACSVYYLSYPVGKFALPKYEGICRQNILDQNISGYYQNPYIVGIEMRGRFNLGTWLNIVISNPFKYIFVVGSSLTGLILIEGFYANITNYFISVPAVVFFGLVKLVFAFYIWFNVVRNFKGFMKYGWRVSVLSILPLVYFVIVVGNYSVEQRWFYPLMPWVYFYAALKTDSIKRMATLLLQSKFR